MENTRLSERIQFYRQEYDLRGVQVVIVQDGQVILHAEGIRNAAGEPVDCQTIFPIGSTSKAFTAAAVAICVERGLLGWDDRVQKHIPGFALHDEYAGQQLTLRDALCHRSGLPRHEFAWMGSPFSTQQLIQRLRYLPPAYPFRAEYHYNNQLYALLGQVVENASGMPFAEFLRRNITGPLGMLRTTFSVNQTPALGNYATPYARTPQGILDLPLFNIDNIGGAGLINSCAADLAAWLQLQLNGGTWNGEPLISASSLQETHSPQIVAKSNFLNTPDFDSRTYSMGWMVENYRGIRQLRHTGGIHGFFSQAVVIPAKNLAVMVLINTLNQDACTPLIFEIIDQAAGYEPRDWAAYERGAQAAMQQGMTARAAQLLAFKNPMLQPSHPLADFAGCYEHPGYGKLAIIADEDGLRLSFHIYQMALEHLNLDTYIMRYQGFPVPVRFVSNLQGAVTQVLVNMEHEMEQPIAFQRVA